VWLASTVAAMLITAPTVSAGSEPAPRQRVGADPVKAKAQEAERQRLIAKLRSEAPKVDDAPPPAHPLAAPIFHRYDRP
jgi:hypothetical protein